MTNQCFLGSGDERKDAIWSNKILPPMLRINVPLNIGTKENNFHGISTFIAGMLVKAST